MTYEIPEKITKYFEGHVRQFFEKGSIRLNSIRSYPEAAHSTRLENSALGDSEEGLGAFSLNFPSHNYDVELPDGTQLNDCNIVNLHQTAKDVIYLTT